MGQGAKTHCLLAIVVMHCNGINEYHRLKMHLGIFCFIIV